MKIYKNLLGIISLPLLFLFLTACDEKGKNDGGPPAPPPYDGPVNFTFTHEKKGFHSYSAQITATDHNTTGTLVVSDASSAPSLASISNDAKIIRNFSIGTARKVTFVTTEHFTQAKLTAAHTAATTGGLALTSTQLSSPTYNWLLKANTNYHLYIYYNGKTFDHPFSTSNDYTGTTQISYTNALTAVGVSDGGKLISGNALELKTGEVLGIPAFNNAVSAFSVTKDSTGLGGCGSGAVGTCGMPSDLLISFHPGAATTPNFTNRLFFLLTSLPSTSIDIAVGSVSTTINVTPVTS